MFELMVKSRAKQLKRNEKGFTLVELIVVVAIIGILAAIAIARMGGFGDSARARSVESEHRMLISSIQMWQSQQNNVNDFPTQLSDLDNYVTGGTGTNGDNLSMQKDGTTPAHVIANDELTSTYDPQDASTVWTYDGQ